MRWNYIKWLMSFHEKHHQSQRNYLITRGKGICLSNHHIIRWVRDMTCILWNMNPLFVIFSLLSSFHIFHFYTLVIHQLFALCIEQQTVKFGKSTQRYRTSTFQNSTKCARTRTYTNVHTRKPDKIPQAQIDIFYSEFLHVMYFSIKALLHRSCWKCHIYVWGIFLISRRKALHTF